VRRWKAAAQRTQGASGRKTWRSWRTWGLAILIPDCCVPGGDGGNSCGKWVAGPSAPGGEEDEMSCRRRLKEGRGSGRD
jgi:hypothetical protein